MGEDPALIINPDSIAQIVMLKEGAEALVQAINRSVVAKALILKVGYNMIRECKRFRRLIEKVIDLRDKVVIQKAEIKASRSRRREDTPATGITTGLSTVITKKKKSLNHPKHLNDGKDPFYKFWQRVIRHKITVNEHEMLTAAK